MVWTATSPSPVHTFMRVVVPPVIVGDRICRIVSPVASLLEVEEWAGAWWEPSTIQLTIASEATAAPESLLRDLGIPLSDCVATEPRPAQREIEASMMTLDPDRPANMRFEDEVVRRLGTPKRRKYPGNARFRRGVPPAPEPVEDPLERRRATRVDPDGPRRRATDAPPTDAAE